MSTLKWSDDEYNTTDWTPSYGCKVCVLSGQGNGGDPSPLNTSGAPSLNTDVEGAPLNTKHIELVLLALEVLKSSPKSNITVAELGQCRFFGKALLKELKEVFKSMKELAKTIAKLDPDYVFDTEAVPARLTKKSLRDKAHAVSKPDSNDIAACVVSKVEKNKSLTIAQLGQPGLMGEKMIQEMKLLVGPEKGWATRIFALTVQISRGKVTLDDSKKPLTLCLA